ncbi:hypothetical protein S40293_01463 [Stachybotrys chartarum IBT 40293]|nr:hypothetical protein S40293_01463 [Stachybotrys chartarum IBT 40293]
MPSSTILAQHSLHNLGPLTTVFTAPAACTASAEIYLHAGGSVGAGPRWRSSCGPGVEASADDCHPARAAYSSVLGSVWNDPAPSHWPWFYYEGSACPAEWATVGVAVKSAGGEVSSDGIYRPFGTEPVPTTMRVVVEEVPNVFMRAMAQGETLIACCPSNYDAVFHGGCTSSLPRSSYTADSICLTVGNNGVSFTSTTMWYYGANLTASLAVWPVRHGTVSSGPLEDHEYTAVHVLPMITLVSDGQVTGAPNEEEEESGASRETETQGQGPGGGGESAAGGGAVLLSLGVWVAAALAGVCLMMPL